MATAWLLPLPRFLDPLPDAGFEPVRHYYRPDGLPREEQPWLASVWRKT